MSNEKSKNKIRLESDIKIYEFLNGFAIVENDDNSGRNYVIPVDISDGHGGIDVCNNKVLEFLSNWMSELFSSVNEMYFDSARHGKFGYRVNISVEPIYTDDYVLSTKLEGGKQ